MRTPAGFECKYFYANYYRGRNQQECRLIGKDPAKGQWTPGLCRDCPVPKITRVNACHHLLLDARVVKTWAGLGRKVEVSATCSKSLVEVVKPEVGCGHCHENLEKLLQLDLPDLP
jgi:hypothetical protein